MAYDNKKGGYQQNPQPSIPIDTFFSTDSEGGVWQMMKLSTYGNKISFNFYKGRSGSPEKTQQYVSFDYETMCAILSYVIEPLVRQRAMKFNSGEEYPTGIWLNYNLTFMDKESKQLRTVGNFIIKSEVCASTNRNTVCICYSNGTDEWKVALGSSALQSHVTLENPAGESSSDFSMDIGDSRFQQFAYMIRSIVNNWIVVQGMNHIVGIMMGNFNPIKSKLGIESKKFVGKDNGNYVSDNYRSNAPDAEPSSDSDEGSFGGDMPF